MPSNSSPRAKKQRSTPARNRPATKVGLRALWALNVGLAVVVLFLAGWLVFSSPMPNFEDTQAGQTWSSDATAADRQPKPPAAVPSPDSPNPSQAQLEQQPDAHTPGAAEAVSAHNDTRAAVGRTIAGPLPAMHWDRTIARQAQAYADRCDYKHSRAPGLGENIYAHVGDVSDVALSRAIDFWAAEVEFYEYESGRCSTRTCGHYTQMVWRSTTQLGCAVAVCDRNTPFGASTRPWTMVVCNYSPPGNVTGRKPY